MTHSHVYGTEKLRKTLFFDKKRCIGARVENLLSGRSADIGADRVVIVWSETRRGKKRTFDTTSGELLSVDSDGYAVRSADGLFEVRVGFSEGYDGTLQKRVSMHASRDVFLHTVITDVMPADGTFLHTAPLLPHPLIPGGVSDGSPLVTSGIYINAFALAAALAGVIVTAFALAAALAGVIVTALSKPCSGVARLSLFFSAVAFLVGMACFVLCIVFGAAIPLHAMG